MKIGLALPSFAAEEWRPSVGDLMALADLAESHGFSGLWVADHLLEPPSYNTSWLDPVVTLAAVARETAAIPIGTSVLVLPLRNPVMAANRIATLQYLADGRLTLGIGMGYLEAEFAAANVGYESRSARFTEATDLLCRLLTEEAVTFDGRYYDVEDVCVQPEVAAPRILMAGSGVDRDGARVVPGPVVDRILRTDGWLAGPWAPDVTRGDWDQIAAEARRRERAPEALSKVLMTYTHLVPNARSDEARAEQKALLTDFVGESGWRFAESNYLLGSVDDVRERLHRYASIGIDEVILGLVVSDPAAAEAQLAHWRDHLLDDFR